MLVRDRRGRAVERGHVGGVTPHRLLLEQCEKHHRSWNIDDKCSEIVRIKLQKHLCVCLEEESDPTPRQSESDESQERNLVLKMRYGKKDDLSGKNDGTEPSAQAVVPPEEYAAYDGGDYQSREGEEYRCVPEEDGGLSTRDSDGPLCANNVREFR